MKYIFLILLSVISLGHSYAQKQIVKKSEAEIVKTQLNDSIQKLNDKIEKITIEISNQNKKHEAEINDASRTIEYLNSLVNSFGQIFTILGIFIAVITLVLPILTYQLGIKPSQKALKDLESNMDKRLENYLKNSRDKEIENALKNLREGNAELKNQATSFLALTQHEGFSENQMFQIYSILNKHRDENNVKSQLAFILSTRRNDYANELFNGSDVTKDPVIKQMAYLYFAKIGFKENYEGINRILKESSDPANELITLAFNLMQYSSGQVQELFNDKTILDNLTPDTIKGLKNRIPNSLESLKIDSVTFESCYLNELIKNS